MSKCSKCKYEYLSKCEKPCKYCRERYGQCTLGYSMNRDEFEPKEEKSTIEHDGCNGCIHEHLSELKEPCVSCKGSYRQDTMGYLKAKDCFKPKEKADDEIDMVNHPPHYQHGIEPIEFIESHNLNFNLGSAVKYIARAPYKGKELEDLKKAKWFIEREIKRHDN